MSMLLAEVSPAAALVVFTVGLLLVYVELNRPGRVIPGALGLLLTLLACARLGKAHPLAGALLMVATAGALLALDLMDATGGAVALAATVMLVLGFHLLMWPPMGWMVCILCGVALGGVTAALTRAARRARENKAIPKAKTMPENPVRG
jgi:membrane-bound serine protease (ClpP class)